MNESYQLFLDLLKDSKEKGQIKILHRGMSKNFAFNKLNLDVNLNTIDQFAEKLFFYGEKSKYFWNEKLNTSKHKFEFEINDTSDNFFKYIFNEFNKLIDSHKNEMTDRFFLKNEVTVSFFSRYENIDLFIDKIKQLTQNDRILVRNYYLRILHQLGEVTYKENSQFISSSTSENVAKKFSKSEIMINFWDLDFIKHDLAIDVPMFIGKPYRSQKEISIFTVILPHFIYSFNYQNTIYPNPAIELSKDMELAVFCGLEIKQENFKEKLKTETNYSSGIEKNGNKYSEIK